MSLPHIENSEVGMNKMEPLYKSLYELAITLPKPLQEKYGADVALITEQVTKVEGLDIAAKGAEAGVVQSFMGTSRSFANSKLDNTYYTISVTFNLNLRNGTDNFVYKLFKDWKNLCYNVETGETALKVDYCADFLRVREGNRAGDIYRIITMKDIFIEGGFDNMGDFDYSDGSAIRELVVKFRSDNGKEDNL